MIVKYSKKFPYAPFLNEDIGFEMEVDETYGGVEEKALATLATLKSIAEKFHKENNPQLVGVGLTDEDINWAKPEPFIPQPPPVIDRKAIERMEILIDDAKTIEELSIYKEDAEKHGLGHHYDARRESFKQ